MNEFKFGTEEENAKNLASTLSILKNLSNNQNEETRCDGGECQHKLEYGQNFEIYKSPEQNDVCEISKKEELNLGNDSIGKQSDWKKSNHLSEIIKVANQYEMFLDETGQPCATKFTNGVKKTYCIDDSLVGAIEADYISTLNDIPSDAIIKKTLRYMKHCASENMKHRKTYKRFASIDDCIYHDLNDGQGSVVKIDEQGWDVLVNPPIEFIRTGNMHPLPYPSRDGNYELFFKYLNIKKEEDAILIKSYIPCILNSKIARPALFIVGAKGSCKTSMARFIRSVIDPVVNAVSFPKNNEREMNLIFKQYPFPVFDNVDSYDNRVSNLFCGAITGTGVEERKLYTNSETVFTNYKRSFISTSIDMPKVGSDLIDRAIIIELDVLSDKETQLENALFSKFSNDYANIMGGLYDVLSSALKFKNGMILKSVPRMADFALMASAVGKALGYDPDEVVSIYNLNKSSYYNSEVDDDSFFSNLVEFLEVKNGFCDSVGALFNELKLYIANWHPMDTNCVPKAPNYLSRELKKYTEHLRLSGWSMVFSDHAKKVRTITFNKIVK